jgi:hypothetical protein
MFGMNIPTTLLKNTNEETVYFKDFKSSKIPVITAQTYLTE